MLVYVVFFVCACVRVCLLYILILRQYQRYGALTVHSHHPIYTNGYRGYLP